MKLRAIEARIRQGNGRDAAYNRLATLVGRKRRLLRHANPAIGSESSRRLNRVLGELPNAQRYLEIGLYKGATFETITARERVGVDPNPLFDPIHLPDGASVVVSASDEFFRSLEPDVCFDVVYVDGLHHFDQVYRDIINSFKHLTPGGLVLIDDVIPEDESSSVRDRIGFVEQRKAAALPPAPWFGDVFVVVKVVVDHHPAVRLRTIVGSGNPQTVMWRWDDAALAPIADGTLREYASVRYNDVFVDGVPSWFSPGVEEEILLDAISECSARVESADRCDRPISSTPTAGIRPRPAGANE